MFVKPRPVSWKPIYVQICTASIDVYEKQRLIYEITPSISMVCEGVESRK